MGSIGGEHVPIFTAPYVLHDVSCGDVFSSSAAPTCIICRISAILVSRFLLELQEANQAVLRLDTDDPLHFSRSPSDSGTGRFHQPRYPKGLRRC